MLAAKDGAIAAPQPKSRKPKLYANAAEKELIVENLRTAVQYFGKDYLRKHFKSSRRIAAQH